MRHVTRTATLRMQSIALVIAALMLSTVTLADSYGSITIEREVLLSKGHGGQPQVIVQTADDGFVVAGSTDGAAWAARTNSAGVPRWEYRDDLPDRPQKYDLRSEFRGALVLADNSVMLCGQKEIGGTQVGLLVRIDSYGKLVEQRHFRPNDDSKYFRTIITQCGPWGDGFEVVGIANAGNGRTDWLVRLDALGQQLWEKEGSDYGASEVFEFPNHDLVLALLKNATDVKLVRIGPSGDIRAERAIANGAYFVFVRSVLPSDSIALAVNNPSDATLYKLDLQLRDTAPPKKIKSIAFERIYELADHSLAQFGNKQATFLGMAENAYSGAIALVTPSGNLGPVLVLKPDYGPSVKDAVALRAPRKFVAVRSSQPSDVQQQGVLMTWVSFR